MYKNSPMEEEFLVGGLQGKKTRDFLACLIRNHYHYLDSTIFLVWNWQPPAYFGDTTAGRVLLSQPRQSKPGYGYGSRRGHDGEAVELVGKVQLVFTDQTSSTVQRYGNPGNFNKRAEDDYRDLCVYNLFIPETAGPVFEAGTWFTLESQRYDMPIFNRRLSG